MKRKIQIKSKILILILILLLTLLIISFINKSFNNIEGASYKDPGNTDKAVESGIEKRSRENNQRVNETESNLLGNHLAS
jgi:hypothetical protein